MSKRGAERQLSKEGGFNGDGSGIPKEDLARPATAAQLAARKIVSTRGSRKPPIAPRPSSSTNRLHSSTNAQTGSVLFANLQGPQDTQSAPNFFGHLTQNGDQANNNPFGGSLSFPQPNNGNSQNPINNSFPPQNGFNTNSTFSFGGGNPSETNLNGKSAQSTSISGSGATGLGTSPFKPPTSSFSFGNGGQNQSNPFAQSQQNNTNTNQAPGSAFSGSIFHFSTPPQITLSANEQPKANPFQLSQQNPFQSLQSTSQQQTPTHNSNEDDEMDIVRSPPRQSNQDRSSTLSFGQGSNVMNGSAFMPSSAPPATSSGITWPTSVTNAAASSSSLFSTLSAPSTSNSPFQFSVPPTKAPLTSGPVPDISSTKVSAAEGAKASNLFAHLNMPAVSVSPSSDQAVSPSTETNLTSTPADAQAQSVFSSATVPPQSNVSNANTTFKFPTAASSQSAAQKTATPAKPASLFSNIHFPAATLSDSSATSAPGRETKVRPDATNSPSFASSAAVQPSTVRDLQASAMSKPEFNQSSAGPKSPSSNIFGTPRTIFGDTTSKSNVFTPVKPNAPATITAANEQMSSKISAPISTVPSSNATPSHSDRPYETSYEFVAEFVRLNNGLREHILTLNVHSDWTAVMEFYIKQANSIRRGAKPDDKATSTLSHPPSMNVLNSGTTLDYTNSSSHKRKADEILLNASGSFKKPKALNVNEPGSSDDATPKETSQTLNFFKSIVDKPQAPEAPANSNVKSGSFSEPQNTSKNTPQPLFGVSITTTASPATSATKSIFAPTAGSPSAQSVPSGASGFKVPTFGAPAGGFGAFAKVAQKSEEAAKKKKKYEEFDSDEEDEAAFDAKLEKEHLEKRAKLNADAAKIAAAANAPRFSVSPLAQPTGSTLAPPTSLFLSRSPSPASSTKGGASVFDSPAVNNKASTNNIFGHLSDNSGGEGANQEVADESEESDADQPGEEQKSEPLGKSTTQRATPTQDSDEDESIEDAMRQRSKITKTKQSSNPSSGAETPKSSEGRSLFDRISKDADGNFEKEAQSTNALTSSVLQPTSGNATTQTAFGMSQIASTRDGPIDQTWKPESPIKFGVQPPTPTKPTTSGSFGLGSSTPPSFGAANSGTPFSIFNFGSSTPKPEIPKAADSSTTPSGPPPSTGASPFGFNFGSPTPVKPNSGSSLLGSGTSGWSLQPPSNGVSSAVSRMSSPGLSSANESENVQTEGEDGEEDGDNSSTLNFAALSEQERKEENLLYECEEVAVLKHDQAANEGKGGWITQAVGTLRLLQRKEGVENAGKVRVLMRRFPSGAVVVNSFIYNNLKHERQRAKIVVFVFPQGNSGLNHCLFRFRRDEDAISFAKLCGENTI